VALNSGSVPGPPGPIRRFGSNAGAGPSVESPGRGNTNRRVAAICGAAAGTLIVVAELSAVLVCTTGTGGLIGSGNSSCGATETVGSACGRTSGIAISNPATANWNVSEPSAVHR